MDNYATTRYALRHLRKWWKQPKYYFFLADKYLAATDLSLTFASQGNVLDVGDSVNLENASIQYSPSLPFNGFNRFLSTEYHELAADVPAVKKLHFTNNIPDPDMRHQLICRMKKGVIYKKQLFTNGRDQQKVKLRARRRIRAIVYAVYSVNENPYYSGGPGRTYDVTIEAR